MRMRDIPGNDEIPEELKNQVMHVTLPIMNGFQLMGSDAPEAMTGRKLTFDNNVYISLTPDTKDEVDRLFKALSTGGGVEQESQEMFWGDYWSSFTDKFGTQWMISIAQKQEA